MNITKHLLTIQQRIHQAEQLYQREPGSVTLLAVSKGQNISQIQAAINAGQRSFGENYCQEALPKIASLSESLVEWHFIGSLQANKTQALAQHFSWVHSVDRLKIAQRLNRQRPSHLPQLNICIEVNLSANVNKSGITLDKLAELAHAINQLENLRLRGLMTIPTPVSDFALQVAVFQQLQTAQANLCAQGLLLDTLSMGMSNDFEAAIAAGSTLVRIGTAIFGPRNKF